MPGVPVTVQKSYADVAGFRAWAQSIHDAILAAGVAAVATTGEADLATMVLPNATNQKRGFKVYKLAGHDGLPDLFVRVDYGSAQGQALMPGLFITPGYNHNGAGSLLGNNDGENLLSLNTGLLPSNETWQAYVSSDGQDRLTIVPTYQPGAGANSNMTMLHIERFRDGSGVAQPAGFFTYGWAANGSQPGSTGRSHCIPVSGSVPSAGGSNGRHPAFDISANGQQSGGGQSTFGLDVAMVPMMPVCGRLYCTSLLIYNPPDIVGGPVDVVVDHFGSARAYKALGPAGPKEGSVSSNSSVGGPQLAIPFY